ncbi:MAG: hypothetical protein LBD67_08465 [Candidatus Accumulibacter sp.]|nr:hypothetical protein [Accumulibacter sp.]
MDEPGNKIGDRVTRFCLVEYVFSSPFVLSLSKCERTLCLSSPYPSTGTGRDKANGLKNLR